MNKEYIIEITTKLFLSNGVKSVTMGEITKELSTSKRTIYNHFIDKTDLVSACMEEYLAKIRSNNDDIIGKSKNAIEAMGYIYQHILSRDESTNSNFYKDIVKYYPSVLKESHKKNGEFSYREFFYLAKWGLEDGLFNDNIDTIVTMRTVNSLLKLCNNTTKFPPVEFSTTRLTKGIMLPYLTGLCTDKGRQELMRFKHLYL